MTSTTKRRKAKAKGVRRISRKTLDTMLPDLAERLNQQVWIGLAIQRANEPNDQHIAIEHQLRTVFGLLLETQLRSPRDIRDLVRMLCGDEVRGT